MLVSFSLNPLKNCQITILLANFWNEEIQSVWIILALWDKKNKAK